MPQTTRSCGACQKPVPDDAAFCPSCGAATPTGQSPSEPAASASDQERAEYKQRLQRVLGETYQLKQMIGLGGFAEVYSAWDPRLKRDVAVKVIRADLAPTQTMLERFRREAEAVAMLRHPNIIPIYSVGEGDGLVYFVMPLVKGESLASALQREKRLSIAETRRVLVEAASGLGEAHEAGLVHRDIKPENIMLEGKHRRVLLMDFGIAKAITSGTEGGGLTMTGMIIGTPQYMSPEQASGERTIDARSDQYSLAIVGYRMLTGDLPFDAKTPAQLVYRQIAETPKRVHELVPEVPMDLSDALARALSKDPAARFPNMDGFAASVAAGSAIADAAVTASAESLERELAEHEAKAPVISRPLLAAGIVGVLAFAALYAFGYPLPLSAPRDTRAAALAQGREFLKQMGAVGSFSEDVLFEANGINRGFLERTIGRAELARRIQAGMPLGEWQLRWSNPGEVEHWKVTVGAGAITGFDHVMADAVAGATLVPEAARAAADSFLMRLGWSTDSLHLLEASSTRRANRTDHHFAFEKAGSTIEERKGDSVVKTASTQVAVDVRGDRVAGYRNAFLVGSGAPVDPLATVLAGSNVAEAVPVFIIFFALFGLALWFTISRARAREVRWRPALLIMGAFVLATMVTQFNESTANQFVFPTTSSRAVLWGGQLLTIVFGSLFLAAVVLLPAAAGESLARLHLPRALSGYYPLLRGKWSDPLLSRAVIRGYAVGFVMVGADAAFRTLIFRVPGARFGNEAGYTSALNSVLPALHPIIVVAGAIGAGLLMLFALVALTRFLKAPWLVLAVVVLAGGFFEPGARPYLLGVVGAAIAAGLMAGGGLRYGVVAVMVAVYIAEALPAGVGFLRAPEMGIVVAGVLTLVAAFLPAIIPLRNKVRATA